MPKAGVRLLLSGYTVASMPKAGVQHQLLRIYSIHAEGWGAASTSQGMASMPKAGVRLLLFSDSATLTIEHACRKAVGCCFYFSGYSIHAEGWGAASTSQDIASMPKAGVRPQLLRI